MRLFRPLSTALLVGAVFSFSTNGYAASCCGGGSASALVMPKFSQGMVDISFSMEQYDGFWDQQGNYKSDPAGSDLQQSRLNLGYGHRFGDRWQGSITLPYVWNDNQYPSSHYQTNGIGDMTLNLWYEGFDNVTCVWKIRKPEDWIPATYYGLSLTVPTGISPYDDVTDSSEITGRGFYRLDANVLIDKTIYPWNMSLQMGYGHYLERSVNREYGNFVEPFDKQLGNRFSASLSGGYTQFLENMNTLTYTLAFSHVQESEGTINDVTDPSTGMRKQGVAFTVAHATMDRDWVIKATYSHSIKWDGWGENFPATDTITLGVSHVLR